MGSEYINILRSLVQNANRHHFTGFDTVPSEDIDRARDFLERIDKNVDNRELLAMAQTPGR